MIQPRVIFVFGSNLRGAHVGGAAFDALRFWGAKPGVGVGATGEAYALPTVNHDMQTMALEDIQDFVLDFLEYAAAHPDQTFYVTPIGCGIAGHVAADIAPLFTGVPVNVQLPAGWRELAQSPAVLQGDQADRRPA